MDIVKILAEEFKQSRLHVENIINLIDEGNTIPFIARYRKELTGSIDDQVLRDLCDRLSYLRGLEERKAQVRSLIEAQGKLDETVEAELLKASTMTEVEDIYRPFRPKRRTRAVIAKEKGLEPLAGIVLMQETAEDIRETALRFINADLGVNTVEEALSGASDIIAEIISDNAQYRQRIRKMTFDKGMVVSKAKDKEAESVYEMYYDYQEPVARIAGHRVLAVNRGENEEFLSVKIEAPTDEIIMTLNALIVKNNPRTKELMENAVEDAYKRLIAPSIEREIRNDITEKAEEGALRVFSENLRMLLLTPPFKGKVVLALDPGFRTGCKVAVMDPTGKVLATGVIYPTPPANKIEESKAKLKPLILKHNVDIIAIGNGTASRETEKFAVDMIKELDRKIGYAIVNEAGASVYSASKLGAEEFKDFDVALRSAVSIGRRLQDPLAELVKIDPKSIGVGQYQHDINQKRLGESLSGVVESCVNSVGVDLNTASASLLGYVAGVTPQVAKNILEYRETHGKFTSREELKKVKKLGPKAFEQCAGFLRIAESNNPLDNTGVHPESYAVCEKLVNVLGFKLGDASANKRVMSLITDVDISKLSKSLSVGAPTLKDIIKELEKPGRDPRDEMPAPILKEDILAIEQLTPGMRLKGTVRNVIDFGVFVDIGVHQDGLVHISQISNKFIKHPLEAVSVGDVVEVSVLNVDVNKKRISLSMKG